MSSNQSPSPEKVLIEYSGGKLAVSPEHALIGPEGSLEFEVQGIQPKATIEVDFQVYADRKGPFAWEGNLDGPNPVRGRYVRKGPGGIRTASEDLGKKGEGYWKYTVILRDVENIDRASLDPGVMVKKK